MTYVQKESQTNQPSLQKTKLKSVIWDSQQKHHGFSNAVKYVKQRILFLDQSGGVDSTAASTLHRSIEKNTPKIRHLSIHPDF